MVERKKVPLFTLSSLRHRVGVTTGDLICACFEFTFFLRHRVGVTTGDLICACFEFTFF